MSEPLLSEEALRDALRRVAGRLAAAGKVGEVLIHGGASMVLVFGARSATRDVDAVILSEHSAVIRAIREVADELGLPRYWLNGLASTYLPAGPDPHPVVVFDHPNLRVMSISPGYLFAMKLRAGRGGRDLQDALLLAREIGVRTPEEAQRAHDQVFPEDPLSSGRLARFSDALALDLDRPG